MSKYIDMIEKNIHGAWVIYGAAGMMQYYFYTKREAIQLYSKKCREAGL